MGKTVKCPRFGCGGIGMPVDTKKKFSFGKALIGNTVGGVLMGPAGAVIGTATGIKGKNGKTTFVCSRCGKVFEKQL